MADYKIYELKIDEDFKYFIPPLSSDERMQLEENIIQNGCREPICVWNKTILDGHNRYEICTRLQIPFKISYIFLRSREEAVAWICANQLGRRNISDVARWYLIGKRYTLEKIIGAHNAAGTNQYMRKEVRSKMYTGSPFDDDACRTRERLGKEYHLCSATIAKYGDYSESLDSISKVEPLLLPKILSGQVKISQENVLELARHSPSDIKRLSSGLMEDTISYAEARNIIPKRKVQKKISYLETLNGSVKNMPTYDPDVEILSLAFTIPSWVSSISRVHSSVNFIEISDNARHRLNEALGNLKATISVMQAAIKEDS